MTLKDILGALRNTQSLLGRRMALTTKAEREREREKVLKKTEMEMEGKKNRTTKRIIEERRRQKGQPSKVG